MNMQFGLVIEIINLHVFTISYVENILQDLKAIQTLTLKINNGVVE